MAYDGEKRFGSAQERETPSHEKIIWSMHAVQRSRETGFRKALIDQALTKCTVIEDYHLTERALPGCLVLSFIDDQPLHMHVAIDPHFDGVVLVSLYRPSPERWEHDWKTRKR